MKFIKRDTDFFELFDGMGKNLLRASEKLVVFFEDFGGMESKIKEIHDIEHDNDLLTHEVIRKLNQTFLTPIDREDIHSLASRMDDILDLMWGAAQRAQLFKLKESRICASKSTGWKTRVMRSSGPPWAGCLTR
jgi:uncharacterized protein